MSFLVMALYESLKLLVLGVHLSSSFLAFFLPFLSILMSFERNIGKVDTIAVRTDLGLLYNSKLNGRTANPD